MADETFDRPIRSIQDLITDDEAGEAMQLLSRVGHDLEEIGELIADAAGNLKRHEEMLKSIEAVGAKLSEETSVQKKMWEAVTTRAYTDRIEMVARATTAHQKLLARRNRLYADKSAAELKIEIWRTLQANQRQMEILRDKERTMATQNNGRWRERQEREYDR